MTKKHFKAFAERIKNSGHSEMVRWAMARLVAETAQEFNPRFDLDRFIEACGLREGK